MEDNRANLDKLEHWGVDIKANLDQLEHLEVDIRVNLARQGHWEVDIRAILVKLDLTGGKPIREEGSKLDIQANQLGIPINQLCTLVSQQHTLANQLVILTSLLPILHNLEDILESVQSNLVQGACHTQPSLLKGCLVCFTQQILIPLDLQLVTVGINNTMQPNQPTLLPVQHFHPQHLPSTLL